MTLSERIIEYRARNDLSQSEFADKVGVGRDIIGRAENGRKVSRLTEAKINLVLRGESIKKRKM